MSKYITSVALLGALLIAAPAAFADYELFAEWRQENGVSYAPGSEVVTLVELTKGGGDTVTNGTVSWDAPNSAWSVETRSSWIGDYYWISYKGDPNAYADLGIVLTGSFGFSGYGAGLLATGLQGKVWIGGDDTMCSLAVLMDFDPGGYLLGATFEGQSYLNGEKTTSRAVDATNDAMVTFLFSDYFTNAIGENGGFGILINDDTRDMSFAIIAVKEPADVPEPATLAIVGLGLAGLGLARRRRK